MKTKKQLVEAALLSGGKATGNFFEEAILNGLIFRKYQALTIDVETGTLIGEPKYEILKCNGRNYPTPISIKDANKQLAATN